MLVEKNINMNSTCEHHFSIVGKAHVAYISNGEVIGLSKINRIVDYYARRPQLGKINCSNRRELLRDFENRRCSSNYRCKTHVCFFREYREYESSSTVTAEYSGKFKDKLSRSVFKVSGYLKIRLPDPSERGVKKNRSILFIKLERFFY